MLMFYFMLYFKTTKNFLIVSCSNELGNLTLLKLIHVFVSSPVLLTSCKELGFDMSIQGP